MRHITAERLPAIEDLLVELRTFDALTERKSGTFYRKSSAFLHFHEDGDDVYADVKLDGRDFERRRVNTQTEQRALISAVRKALR